MCTLGKSDVQNKLYPTSTNNATSFYETKHWVSGAEGSNHAVADEYQTALTHEEGRTVIHSSLV